MTGYVAIACRISKAANGEVEKVDVQERQGRAYAAEHWPGLPIEVFKDNNLSAADDTYRPEHKRFRRWVGDGRIAHVWCPSQSRLERKEIEWFQLAAELDAAGITELHTRDHGIVGVRDVVCGIKAVLNAEEVREIKRRVRARLASNAEKGIPNGGSYFGYRHGVDATGVKTLVVDDQQADAVRESAARILSGWSLTNIARDLRAQGLKGSHGGRIDVSAVKRMCTNPVVSGHRTRKGKIVGKGNWPAILADDTRLAVERKLAQDRMVRTKTGGTYEIATSAHKGHAGRKYLLTGLARCGVCGAPCAGTLKQRRKGVDGLPYLVCSVARGGKGCVGAKLDEVEREVVDTLLGELGKPEYGFLAAIVADEQAERRDQIVNAIAALDEKRHKLAGLWSNDALTDDEWETAKRGLDEREQGYRRELVELPPSPTNIDIDRVRTDWLDGKLTLDERREILSLFIESVTINRLKGTAPRVVIRWHGQPDCDCPEAA